MSDKFNFKSRTKERSFVIELDNVSKRHLLFFMKNELDYYNNVINNGTMRLRAFPEEIVAMREGYGRLWSTIAFYGKNLREFLKKDLKSWPKTLRDSLPQSAIQNNQIVIDEKKLMLLDSISVTGNIHPVMRQNIASELLSTMLPQADQLVQGQNNSTGQMKDPVHMLVPRNYPERRHIQLTRDLVKMKWDKEKEITEIMTPYTDKPLIVKDHNLTEEKFNVMLIRQQPNVQVNVNTPWQIDLMITNHKYLMDITDQNLYVKKKRAA